MCGHWPITWNHVLRNARTADELVVGSGDCIVNYKEEMGRAGHDVPPVVFGSAGAAKYMNDKCPGIAVVGPIGAAECDWHAAPAIWMSLMKIKRRTRNASG